MSISKDDINNFLIDSNLSNKNVIVHASLSSIGHVDGGADTIIDALMKTCRSIYMPAFSYESNTSPPLDDRPPLNGCNYDFYNNWNYPQIPFDPIKASINDAMGLIAKTFFEKEGVSRSSHGWNSWLGWGEESERILADHKWNRPNQPLEKLMRQDAVIILLGVGLEKCTALHLAEELAGRKPFIRWMVDSNKKVRRIRVNGCGNGFSRLFNLIDKILSKQVIGNADVLIADLKDLVLRCCNIIKENPYITMCSIRCRRCQDAISGGPRDHGPIN